MAAVRIRQCPCLGCYGWLEARRRALTMHCACDECGEEFLVSWAFGFTDPWRTAPFWHRMIADAACRFGESSTAGEKKRTGVGPSPEDFRMLSQEAEASKRGEGVLTQEEVETLLQSIGAPESTKKITSSGRMRAVIDEGKARRLEAMARVQATTTHPAKHPKQPSTKEGEQSAQGKAQIIPRERIEEERDRQSSKSIDEMLDATVAKKTKKGP